MLSTQQPLPDFVLYLLYTQKHKMDSRVLLKIDQNLLCTVKDVSTGHRQRSPFLYIFSHASVASDSKSVGTTYAAHSTIVDMYPPTYTNPGHFTVVRTLSQCPGNSGKKKKFTYVMPRQ